MIDSDDLVNLRLGQFPQFVDFCFSMKANHELLKASKRKDIQWNFVFAKCGFKAWRAHGGKGKADVLAKFGGRTILVLLDKIFQVFKHWRLLAGDVLSNEFTKRMIIRGIQVLVEACSIQSGHHCK